MIIYKGYEIPNTFEEIVEISKHCVFGMGIRIPSLQYRIDERIVINIPVTLDQVEEASKSGK